MQFFAPFYERLFCPTDNEFWSLRRLLWSRQQVCVEGWGYRFHVVQIRHSPQKQWRLTPRVGKCFASLLSFHHAVLPKNNGSPSRIVRLAKNFRKHPTNEIYRGTLGKHAALHLTLDGLCRSGASLSGQRHELSSTKSVTDP